MPFWAEINLIRVPFPSWEEGSVSALQHGWPQSLNRPFHAAPPLNRRSIHMLAAALSSHARPG
jgi:hypothetical protein